MSTQIDPLQRAPETPDRVNYATGMLLAADDFEAEQLYHRGRLARALAYLAGSGTVAGLRVEQQPATDTADERVVIRPGMALDRLGRLIEVPRDLCIRLDRWFSAQPAATLDAGMHDTEGGVIVDVFIRFVPCPRGMTPAFASGPFDATDSLQPSRLRDGCEAGLFVRTEPAPQLPDVEWAPLAGTTPEERRAALQEELFQAWAAREGAWTSEGLAPQREHLVGQDTTSVFLARLVLPATRGGPGAAPVRTPDAAVTVDNHSRRFVPPLGLLARWAEL